VSGRNRDENKTAFLLEHLVLADAVRTAATEHISAFDKFVGMRRDFNIPEQFFYGNIPVRRQSSSFIPSHPMPMTLTERPVFPSLRYSIMFVYSFSNVSAASFGNS
jgi:hypothetical protein